VCEMLAVAAPTPMAIEDILEWGRLLDEYGLAGYGWGLVWADGTQLYRYRSVEGIRRDITAPRALRHLTVQRAIVHLRRPSLMTTIGHVNVQPYLTPDNAWAFSHNGYLKRYHDYRADYAAHLEGTSDSEVGFHYWLDQRARGLSLQDSLTATHRTLQGQANFMVLGRDGTLAVYAGNEENDVYTFRLGAISLATTALHSFDRFVFDTIFPGAQDIQRLDRGTCWELPAG
jgi:predicted glutamine amidotransferase